ncbi:adenylate/guanylate cyclase domain-containing protein [Rhizobium sullae]|uniref:Adenylate/guanylate cyclase domain-containing protein n=1 Tax=Rhizobium sullae TaxID=50338 RepID=A0A2N0D1K5_RHISU|nr:adenylate/guanylate cyclase domain-containing protein [Rhizobium sullae]
MYHRMRSVILRCWLVIIDALIGTATPGFVSARIQSAIAREQQNGEILIGWVQAAIILVWGLLYAVSRKTFPADASFEPVPWTLAFYAIFLSVRLWLAYERRSGDWLVALSIIVDIAVLMLLIWSFHIQYRQPPAFYLKAPTLLYIFIFITLRALRFEARWILLAGSAGAVGWLLLVLYAITNEGGKGPITHDYVLYMTSPTVLLGAEFDKIISILMVTIVLAVVLQRARRLLERAAIDHATATELSRFVAADVAETIRGAETSIQPGQAEIRPAAAVFIDLRGFTALSRQLPPAELMSLLGDYQRRVIPLVQSHRGSIDKFLGDGILATFGAVLRSETYAADALRAIDVIVYDLTEWRSQRRAAGLAAPAISVSLATGDVLFGAIGDETRLEYTVIGDAVNTAAKLEKHTRVEQVTALTDLATSKLALAQGYSAPRSREIRKHRRINGIERPLDLVVIAK